jgi:4-diphosphocytidyl-2-C-methyl-D-erythritol kinase
MIVNAPAKINLTLEVLARRGDGYHGIRSVMVPLELADELQIEGADAFEFRCDDPSLAGDDNLVVRAIGALGPAPRCAVELRKRIPTQAGLGGGSSDAAAVLRAAMHGAFGRSYQADWLAIARSLGSDVPFFLVESGALVEGTGERVTASGRLPSWHVLVIKPPDAVSTAQAYADLDAHPRPTRTRSDSLSIHALVALQRRDFNGVVANLHNDFQDIVAAKTPSVARAIDALRRAGARNTLLCGSGSAVFTLARDGETIAAIGERLDLDANFARFPTRFADSGRWHGEA